MSARRGGGGGGVVRVDARPNTFLKKVHVGAFSSPYGGILFFHEEGLFFHVESHFFLWGRFWGLPPSHPPAYKELCWHPCPHPMGARRSFRREWAIPKGPS